MNSFMIRSYPISPSANSIYSEAIINGRTRKFKNQAGKVYESNVRDWALMNAHQLQTARIQIERMTKGQVLLVDRVFYHNVWRILTKAGTPKRNDTSNRLKILDDTLAALLGIDDCYFWDGSFQKRITSHEALGEYVDIKFTVINLADLGVTPQE